MLLARDGQEAVGTAWDGVRFRDARNGAQFKTYKLFVSGMFHVILSEHGGLRVTKTLKREAVTEGDHDGPDHGQWGVFSLRCTLSTGRGRGR